MRVWHTGAFNLFRSHNLRKWFAQQLENTTLGYMNTRRLMGHQVYDQTSRRYFKTNEEVLYNLYLDNMNVVSIFSNLQVFNHTSEEVKELQEELKRRGERDLARDEELRQMRKDLDRSLQIKKMEENLTKE